MLKLNLLPCPFCGSKEYVDLVYEQYGCSDKFCFETEEQLDDSSIPAHVYCYHCHIEFTLNGSDKTPKDVLEAWNSRV